MNRQTCSSSNIPICLLYNYLFKNNHNKNERRNLFYMFRIEKTVKEVEINIPNKSSIIKVFKYKPRPYFGQL
jgi:hypothetical protein